MGETIAAATPKAGMREWIGLAVIALPCLLYSMDLTVLHLAVPRLTEALAPSSVQLLWIIDIYGFLLAGSLITMGSLGDRIGRRRLLLIGAAFFGAASILAAFSRSATMLIVSRALLGIAGATIAPTTLSLIRNMFLDARERTTAISIWIIAFSLGGAIGPLLGGAILEYFSWGAVFLLSVPVMILLLAVGRFLLFGAFLFLPQYLQLVLGLSPLHGGLWTLPWALGFVLGSLLTPALARRIRPATLMSAGLALSAGGYFLLAAVGAGGGGGGGGGLILFAVATFVLTFFGSPLFTLTNDVIIGSAPPERAGAASGISETCAELGGALGIAFYGSIGVAIYRGALGAALPAGLPADVTHAALATLGGAVVAAQQLPGETGTALLGAARDAFVRGLVLCQMISGIGTLLLAIFAWATFRSAPVARP